MRRTGWIVRVSVASALGTSALFFAVDPTLAPMARAGVQVPTLAWTLSNLHPGQASQLTIEFRNQVAQPWSGLIIIPPTGSRSRLSLAASPGLGSARSALLSGGRLLVSFSVPKRIPYAQLRLSGWVNPNQVGWTAPPKVWFLPVHGRPVAAPPLGPRLLSAGLATSLSGSAAGKGVQLNWRLVPDTAVPFSRLDLALPVELGSPISASVATSMGRWRQSRLVISRTSIGVTVILPKAVKLSRGAKLDITLVWPARPTSISDLPLPVSLSTLRGLSLAVGAGARTPAVLAPPACGAYRSANYIAVENSLPGVRVNPFESVAPWRAPTGWAGVTSAQCGDRVAMHVSSARSYQIIAYRLGWYSGTGTRLVYRSGPLPPVVQPAPHLVTGLNLVSTDWAVTSYLSIGTAWTPGDYLLELVNNLGATTTVPLVIRDDANHTAILVQESVLTWQAYNNFGGYSLYHGPDRQTGDRARAVTFDRPYAVGSVDSSGDSSSMVGDAAFVRFVERSGLNVTYWTDLDLQQQPELLSQHRALVLLGHSEYWTQEMRAAVTAARDSGLSLAFLGANNIYWRARLVPNATGQLRTMVVYRNANEDPIRSANYVTVRFRDPPSNQPEQTLVGVQYDCLGADAPLLVTDPTAWVYAGTGLTAGSELAHLVYGETDRVQSVLGAPSVQVLAQSPLTCGFGGSSSSDMTYYSTTPGSGVFAAGTLGWLPALDGQETAIPFTPSERIAVAQITLNVLTAFAAGNAPASVASG